MKKVYEYIEETSGNFPFLVHAKNIDGKRKSKKNLRKMPVLDLFAGKYASYLKGNLALSGTSHEVIVQRVALLNRSSKGPLCR